MLERIASSHSYTPIVPCNIIIVMIAGKVCLDTPLDSSDSGKLYHRTHWMVGYKEIACSQRQ